MNVKREYACDLLLLGVVGGLVFASGCVVAPENPPPPVIRSQPMVVESVAVPSYYVVADGEYVGWVGSQYYYLSSGGVWLICDPVRLERFRLWRRNHGDWRRQAIPNQRFRRDAQGREHFGPTSPHVQPGRPVPQMQQPRGRDVPYAQPQQGKTYTTRPQSAKPYTQPQQSGRTHAQPQSRVQQPQQAGRSGVQQQTGKPDTQSDRKDARVQPKSTPSPKTAPRDEREKNGR